MHDEWRQFLINLDKSFETVDNLTVLDFDSANFDDVAEVKIKACRFRVNSDKRRW